MADVGRIVVSLVAVFGALLGTTWLARRSKASGRGSLRIVSRVGVSKGSSLLVVSVGSRMMLVGATEGSLRLLSELDPADLDGSPAEAPAEAAPSLVPALQGATAPQLSAGPSRAALTPSVAAVLAAPVSVAAIRSTGGPWTGLVRNLQRMTLRTAPEGPFHARKR